MNRAQAISRLQNEHFDVLVIGGGATGLGCALDAASRGYRTALVEKYDFASGTSSRSTKLIHGGVRYLRRGNVHLVRQALRERAVLLANAPSLVRPLPFFIPCRNAFERLSYAAGLRIYDALAGSGDLPRSSVLAGGVQYYDAQFDDARLAIAIAQTAWSHGAALANYAGVERFEYKGTRLAGAVVCDSESGERFTVRARAIVNATGIFCDDLRRLDDPHAQPLLAFSRGSHIVVPAAMLELNGRALLVPKTGDGRVLFAIPWHGSTLAGTTDVPVACALHEPAPDAREIAWILSTLALHTGKAIAVPQIQSAFAGMRPLLRARGTTAQLSREHLVLTSRSGLTTVTGGKWTTYRVMAQDAVSAAARSAGLREQECATATLALASVPLVPSLEEAIQHEMARRLDDLLARRTRALFVDARGALAQVPQAADRLSAALEREPAWREREVRRFSELARTYIPV